MAIDNGTCISFCNQPKAQFGYLMRVTLVCRCLHPFCGWRYLATSRESKTHFGLPGYVPGTIAVNLHGWKENSMLVKRIAACTRFLVFQPVSSKVRHFSTFLHILAPPGYAPGTIAVNVTWMERWFNADQTHRSMSRLRAIARCWSEIATFSYPLHLTPPLGCSHWIPGKSLDLRKLESWGYQAVKTVWQMTIGWVVWQNTSVWQTDRQTNRQTDGRTSSP